MTPPTSTPPPTLAASDRPVLEFVVPGERERAQAHFARMVRGDGPGPGEYHGLRRDGGVFEVEANGEAIRDAQGRPASVVLVVRDITERRRLEQERRQLQARLNQAQKLESLGSLAGGVAHDMNNVLAAILGMASLHREQAPPGSPLAQGLETITRAAERGGRMVKSLLRLARQNPAEERELDLNALLKEEVRLLERITLARARLELDLDPGLRPVLGDAAALAHAVMNLVVNAVDAMPGGGTLILRTRNAPRERVELQVEDTGCGMPREVLDKALDPFFTTKEVGKGTGLGLSMVYGTVKAHRGQLDIQSQPGKGTLVTLAFPACAAGTQVQAAGIPDRPAPDVEPLAVLLVDDDDLVQDSVRAILEVLGHTVVLASSGEEALAKVEDFHPDLVILDVNMPGLGGSGTLPRLRALLPDVPVLLVTGRADQATHDLAARHPGVTLLAKPFGLRDLQQYLESLGRRDPA